MIGRVHQPNISALAMAYIIYDTYMLFAGCEVCMVKKLKSDDFYLPSRGYPILFKNESLLLQFRFKPKISSRELITSNSSEICPKYVLSKTGSKITIATLNNEKTTQL